MEVMAAVMELTQATVHFSFPVDEEPLQVSDYGPLAVPGGGSEEPLAAFDVSDYVAFHAASLEGSPFAGEQCPNLVLLPAEGSADSSMVCHTSNSMLRDQGGRIAFRTESELDVLDDGYKWRKYGKKSVKNSPNPRNYYRCSAERCSVKKRVERDREDPRFVITTYDGTHNHLPPGVVYHPVPRDRAAAAAAGTADGSSSCSWMDTMMAASEPWETPQLTHSSSS